MIDLRYYSEQESNKEQSRSPLTELPNSIAKIIKESELGGVILFSDNMVSVAQTIKLNHDLQQAAVSSQLGSPLLISVDQEGGRVFRSNREQTIAFTGNMAIGATYQNKGTYYASKTAKIIGLELHAMGFNVNHAPSIDVNSNANNPVINVRSFGENPDIVAELGIAQIEAYQSQGIISTIKHFPGHGDTETDSHTGLPRVEHDLETILKMDIGPYKRIIDTLSPGMIMTAHIQYPALDSSTLTALDNSQIIKPATMSRKIMTGLLRNQLGYNGVIITDALDMAGVNLFFSPCDAVINTFKAGVDIALMPIKIRSPKDLKKLDNLIDHIVKAVESGELSQDEISESFERIQKLKCDYKLTKNVNKELNQQLSYAASVVNTDTNRNVEQQLAEDAITLVTGKQQDIVIKEGAVVHLIMPDKNKAICLASAIKKHVNIKSISYSSIEDSSRQEIMKSISQADIVIGAHISPRQSAAEMGGMDDLHVNNERSKNIEGPQVVYSLLANAKALQKHVLFISLRTPYEITDFAHIANATLATYAYNTHLHSKTTTLESPSLEALAKVLAGKITPKGSLPVTVPNIS